MAGRIGWAKKRKDPWVVSSWAFRQLLEDVLAQHPNDPELASELTTASRTKCLYIDSFPPEFTSRMTEAILVTASAVCSGQIESGLARKPYGTAEIIAEYRYSLQRLMAMLGSMADFAP